MSLEIEQIVRTLTAEHNKLAALLFVITGDLRGGVGNGGLLLAGELTAKAEPREERNHEARAAAAGPRSPNRFATRPSWSGSPAFVIRAPPP